MADNFKKIRTYFKDSLGRFMSKILFLRAEVVYKSKKTKILNRLLKHPVSIELNNKTSNSKFLGGYGTLFGFIGFESGDNPVSYLYNYLNENIQASFIQSPDKLSVTVLVKVPSYEEMRLDPGLVLPWNGGISWPEALEVGIDNFGNFLSSMTRSIGRSELGIQSRFEVRPSSVIQINYLKDIYKNDTNFGP